MILGHTSYLVCLAGACLLAAFVAFVSGIDLGSIRDKGQATLALTITVLAGCMLASCGGIWTIVGFAVLVFLLVLVFASLLRRT